MAKTRAEKEAEVRWLEERLSSGATAVLADYRGLDVEEMTELRRRLRAADVELRVVKNTLTERAARGRGIDGDLAPYLVGPTAIAFSPAEPTAAARELAGFARGHQDLQLKAGILDGRVIDAGEVRTLAELPAREVLLGRVAGTFMAPVQSLAICLAAPLRQLAVLADQLRLKREATA